MSYNSGSGKLLIRDLRLLCACKPGWCRYLHCTDRLSYLRYAYPQLLFSQSITHRIPDLTVLPSNSPDLLTAPTATTPAFIAVSLAFTIIFFTLFSLTAFRAKMGKFGNVFDRPGMQRATAWIGLLGFLIGKYATYPRQRRCLLICCMSRYHVVPRHSYVVRQGRRGLQQQHFPARLQRSPTDRHNEQWLHQYVLAVSLSYRPFLTGLL